MTPGEVVQEVKDYKLNIEVNKFTISISAVWRPVLAEIYTSI